MIYQNRIFVCIQSVYKTHIILYEVDLPCRLLFAKKFWLKQILQGTKT